MIKKTIGLFVFSGLAFANTVCMEDLKGSQPQSDRDFQDICISTRGIGFNLTSPFVFNPIPEYTETPLSEGFYYFSYAYLSGNAGASFLSSQSAYSDVMMVSVNGGSWQDIPSSGELNITGSIGDSVVFGVRTPYETFYSIPSLNSDGLDHAVVHSPEPFSFILIGSGLFLVGFKKFKN